MSVQAPTQRRILTVLVAAQVLSGVGLTAGVAYGGLLTQDMLGTTSLVGLSSAASTAGAALAAVAIGRISQAHGRPGLAAGYLTGAVGSLGVVAAAVVDSAAMLLLALFVYGVGMATNLQARYAGADQAAPTRRARAVSTALVATTVGGMVGPNLATLTSELTDRLGIPYLAGPFVLASIAYATAALILIIWLRPDPLLLASHTTPSRPTPEGQGLLFGASIMALTQLVMVAVMTMTPVHIHNHGHGTAASGFVIAVHIGAMYLPSPLTGWLVDRYGPRKIAAASGLTLLAAGIVAASVPDDAILQFAVALALLGIGWNFGLVSGTAVIADAAPTSTRAKVQGTVDVSVAIAAATGGMASGLVVTAASYPFLALSSGILAIAIVPAAIHSRTF
ncbi:MFS transporter [Kibdelosporangium philippinense]|uniref:MFS transporter n=1 Tax=Kibdelosporangium philippinense TaxID=211113 RepID=A0ABS8Z6U9_9PSEU|nr:MFS transporter [Kibdelosporangium philippinense]MCE7002784.1 MFS transporter [Kibdelosporangium philippinense]